MSENGHDNMYTEDELNHAVEAQREVTQRANKEMLKSFERRLSNIRDLLDANQTVNYTHAQRIGGEALIREMVNTLCRDMRIQVGGDDDSFPF